jgi:putative FmdB family regulatory protein
MPIYEYLCPQCHRVYSFLARSMTTTREPVCPKCGATDLHKMVSRFAFVRGGAAAGGAGGSGATDEPAGPGGPDLDDPRIEREMMRLMSEVEHMDEDDPRQIGRLMRRMSEVSGETMEPEMEEAVRRLEAGEDPEKVEEDLGDFFGPGDDASGSGSGYEYDDGLYDL